MSDWTTDTPAPLHPVATVAHRRDLSEAGIRTKASATPVAVEFIEGRFWRFVGRISYRPASGEVVVIAYAGATADEVAVMRGRAVDVRIGLTRPQRDRAWTRIERAGRPLRYLSDHLIPLEDQTASATAAANAALVSQF